MESKHFIHHARRRLFWFFVPLMLLWVAMFAALSHAHAQGITRNTYNVLQFPGNTVGAKVTAAQAACDPNTTIPCLIVFDPMLAGWPQGSLPSACSQCVWMRYDQGQSGASAGLNTANVFTKNQTLPLIQNGPVFDIRAFGAKCDGSTDDTAAINAALAVVLPLQATMYVPMTSATCVVAGTLSPITAAITILGDRRMQYTGSGSTLKFTGNGGGACSEAGNGYLQIKANNVSLDGVTLTTTQPTAGTCMVNLGNGGTEISGFLVTRSKIDGGGSTSTNYLFWISAMDTAEFTGNVLQNAISMIYHPGSHGLEKIAITGNTFTQCTGSDYMINLQNGQETDSVHISSNVFEGSNACNNGIKSIAVNASSGILIFANWFGDVGTAVGTWIYTGGASVIANKIIAPSAAGSYALQIQNNTNQSSFIQGNTFQGAQVFLVGDAELFGNKFTYTTSYAVKMQAGQVIAHGNVFAAGSYNSYYCFASPPCKLYLYDTADSSSGPNANVTVLYSYAWATAPVIASGFGTAASIPSNLGTQAFTVNVGTGGTASSGVITMPAAAHGWSCGVTDITHPFGNLSFVSGTSTTSITISNSNLSGAAAAWTASDVLSVNCEAY